MRSPLSTRVRPAFTLLEVVLALALSAAVLYLLTSAIELFLIRVDSSRSRVEAAQVARAVFDMLGNDLRQLRVAGVAVPQGGPSSGTASPGGAAGPGQQSGGPTAGANQGTPQSGGANATGAAGGSSPAAAPMPPAFVGLAQELRFNRGGAVGWERRTRPIVEDEPAAADLFPATVHYWFSNDDRRTAAAIAAIGATAQSPTRLAGLYRDEIATSATAPGAGTTSAPTSAGAATETALPDDAQSQLIAPEVVDLKFSYYDGTQFVDEWDPTKAAGLPKGIEATLRVMETSYEEAVEAQRDSQLERKLVDEGHVVVYRRFFWLPSYAGRPPDQMLLGGGQQQRGGNGVQGGSPGGGQGAGPQGQNGQNGQGGAGGGQNGQGDGGGGGQGGQR